jgi:hypothetical protein
MGGLTIAGATALAGALSAGAAGAATGIQAGTNKWSRRQAQKMFDEQMAFAREQWDYQKYAAENAYQIAVNDAEHAGLSPLAVLDAGVGSATSASGVSQPSAYDPSAYTPDMNTFMDGIRGASSALVEYANNKAAGERNSADNSTKLQSIELNYEKESLLLSQRGDLEAATLTSQLAAAKWTTDSSQQHDINMSLIDGFKAMTGGVSPRVEYFTNEDDYNAARIQYDAKLQPILEEYSKMTNVKSVGSSESENSNVGGNLGANVVGSGGSAGFNKSSGSSESSSVFENKTDNNRAWFAAKCQEAGLVLPLMRVMR